MHTDLFYIAFVCFSGSKIVVIVGVVESPFGPSSLYTYYETTSVNSDYNQIWRSSFFSLSLTLFGMKKINKYIYK
jgi:hypothetical protein